MKKGEVSVKATTDWKTGNPEHFAQCPREECGKTIRIYYDRTGTMTRASDACPHYRAIMDCGSAGMVALFSGR